MPHGSGLRNSRSGFHISSTRQDRINGSDSAGSKSIINIKPRYPNKLVIGDRRGKGWFWHSVCLIFLKVAGAFWHPERANMGNRVWKRCGFERGKGKTRGFRDGLEEISTGDKGIGSIFRGICVWGGVFRSIMQKPEWMSASHQKKAARVLHAGCRTDPVHDF